MIPGVNLARNAGSFIQLLWDEALTRLYPPPGRSRRRVGRLVNARAVTDLTRAAVLATAAQGALRLPAPHRARLRLAQVLASRAYAHLLSAQFAWHGAAALADTEEARR